MMKSLRLCCMLTGITSLLAWFCFLVLQRLSVDYVGKWNDTSITSQEVVIVTAMFGAVISLVILIEIALVIFSIRTDLVLLRPSLIALIAGVAVTPSIPFTAHTSAQVNSVPIGSLLSPAMCAGVLQTILRRRREQIQECTMPRRLTEPESLALSHISYQASLANCVAEVSREQIVDSEVSSLLQAIDEIDTCSSNSIPDLQFQEDNQQMIVVHLFGFPQVCNNNGDIAEFRKKRALELLTWLSLNRDRARRSAARTAMWDLAINDSTFSTVVSDMRRGLSSLDQSIDREAWVPVTYTDEIPLHSCVISDADLMARALRDFQNDSSRFTPLVQCLNWVRDIPFAGTTYSWADLDGSTTRLVILAVSAATELAEFAIEQGDNELLETAIRAGLRVMPGNEELLGLQRSHVAFTPRP